MKEMTFSLSKEELQSYIDEPYLSRGADYFNGRNVEITSTTTQHIKGRVLGTSVYRVELTRQGKLLDGYCTCPAYENWGPCKHLAAFGLAIIHGKRGGYEPSARFKEEIEVYDRVESSLKQKTKRELVDLIMEIIADDPDWLYELDE